MFKHKGKLGIFLLLMLFLFVAEARTVVLEGTNDLRFSQEKITVHTGEEVILRLHNPSRFPASAMAHNFVLLAAGADAEAINAAGATTRFGDYIPDAMSDQIIAHTRLVDGRASDTVTFTAPSEPGTYTYICTFPGHYDAGMKGQLIVTARSVSAQESR